MGVKKNLSFEKPFFLFKLGSLSKLSGENVELKYITGGSVCVFFFFFKLTFAIPMVSYHMWNISLRPSEKLSCGGG